MKPKPPSPPEPTLERRLQEINLIAQENSHTHLQTMAGIMSGTVGFLYANNTPLEDFTLYSLLLTIVPLTNAIHFADINSRAKEFFDQNGLNYLNTIQPSSSAEHNWLQGWKKQAPYYHSITPRKAKLFAFTGGLIEGTKKTILTSLGSSAIGYAIGYFI